MKRLLHCIIIILTAFSGYDAKCQLDIYKAQPKDQLLVFWKYCSSQLLSDQDSLIVHRLFDNVIHAADSLDNQQLKAYALYFKKTWRIMFSEYYEVHFPTGGYQQAVDILFKTQEWASKKKYHDIVASCDHYMGMLYYRANRYGLAFEHLLKADDAFRKIGYQHVPNVSNYLYSLGLCFYKFEEYDKALNVLLEATRYYFFLTSIELNTLNAIGLIYGRKNEPAKAAMFFRNTIAKAKMYNDQAWVGIAAGNLGNIFLKENRNDSALFYHRINYRINALKSSRAPEDAAKSALSIAKAFLRTHNTDSASFYIQAGKQLADRYIIDSTERLEWISRMLQVVIENLKEKGDFRKALLLTDSLSLVDQQMRIIRDSKILSRAIEKTEATSYNTRITLLKSQKDLAQARLYFIIMGLFILLILIGFISRDKWLRKKRQFQLVEKDKQILVAEKLRAEEGLKHAQDLLTAYIDMIKEKATLIDHLESELTILKKVTLDAPELYTITSNREKLVASTILTDNDWQQFRVLFEQVYPGFSYRLKENYPELSPAEARLLYLIKLNLSTREMAAMLGISVYTIHKLRYRLRKKLNLEEDKSLNTIIRRVN